MLLVLALVSMGDSADPQAAEASRPTPAPTVSASADTAPKPSPTGQRSVEREPVKLSVRAGDGETARMIDQLHAATELYKGRQAAFVLTFGHAPKPVEGQAYAREINKALRKARPNMFADATTRDFWNGGPVGAADLEIYFYTQ